MNLKQIQAENGESCEPAVARHMHRPEKLGPK